jgi:hypothetical protein
VVVLLGIRARSRVTVGVVADPRCRSRFGVFDQHGNVAEIMTRLEPADGEVKSQLKGSALFYVDAPGSRERRS